MLRRILHFQNNSYLNAFTCLRHSRIVRLMFIPLIIALILTTAYVAADPARLYVNDDASGASDGTNWENAFRSLQSAIGVAAQPASPVKEIWVAAGRYTPAPPGGDRDSSFSLPSGVALYGGFAGTESLLSERALTDPAKPTTTTLSGDLRNDDSLTSTNIAENAYHVVSAVGVTSATLLDGFTITGGYANGAGNDNRGAGIFISAGSPTIRNCRIALNRTGDGLTSSSPDAGPGAGIYCADLSSVILDSCSVTSNTTGEGINFRRLAIGGKGGAGAGICSVDTTIALIACKITGNQTGNGGFVVIKDGFGKEGDGGSGGGISLLRSNCSLSQCTIQSNRTGHGGGAGYGSSGIGGKGGDGGGICATLSFLSMTTSSITGNKTGEGGLEDNYQSGAGGDGAGLYASDCPIVSFLACIIEGNIAGEGKSGRRAGQGGGGGGLWINSCSSVFIADSVFENNASGHCGGGDDGTAPGGDGGAIYCAGSSPAILNCAFMNNITGEGGSGKYGVRGGNGAGMYFASSSPTIRNCRIIQNKAGKGGLAWSAASPRGGGEGGRGGAIYLTTSSATIRECEVLDNCAGDGGNSRSIPQAGTGGMGGSICVVSSTLDIANSIIFNNRGGNGGTASFADFSDRAPGGNGGSGGGIFCSTSSPTLITNCTITSNSAGLGGWGTLKNGDPGMAGGLLCVQDTTVSNTILWGNRDSSSTIESAQIRGPAQISYSCVQGWTGLLGGAGNMGRDPLFADSPAGDFHLTAASPCVDAGRLVSLGTDFEGNPRPFNGTPPHRGDGSDFDIGADEYAVVLPPTQAAGEWTLY